MFEARFFFFTKRDLQYGKKFVELKTDSEGGTVTAMFEDGTKEEGKLLIGCDGAHSRVRNFLLSPEKAALKPLPFLNEVVMTSLPEEIALAIRKVHPRAMAMLDPSGCFGWISGTSTAQNSCQASYSDHTSS
jgi:2-polyprenyl-6-methoxyphenol hydroxylase-like FAD-dependent oxidoreductase